MQSKAGVPKLFSTRPKREVWCLPGTQTYKNISEITDLYVHNWLIMNTTTPEYNHYEMYLCHNKITSQQLSNLLSVMISFPRHSVCTARSICMYFMGPGKQKYSVFLVQSGK